MQVEFNCLLSHKDIMRYALCVMLPLSFMDFNSLFLMFINTLWLDAYVNSLAFEEY